MADRLSFPKSEKLCGKIRIKNLYEKGRHFTCYPLRVTYLFGEQGSGQKEFVSSPTILVWAPKSLFKRAVMRNRLRRLMREAYRQNAGQLRDKCAEKNIPVQIAFNYISKEECTFNQIEKAMKKALQKIVSLTEYENSNS